ncbi:unnamed protein product [Rotaria sordida]|uniref:Uncharacterized protein n=2 Tax=Rotaria sordida TaxID=392033 RepID=A0A819CT73_9BILA|nr:unnamed protein product [Rotaria sordida]
MVPFGQLSSSWGLDYSANCSNLLSGYIYINQNDLFKQDCFLSCSSLCLRVIHNHGTTKIFDEEYVNWLKGDLLIIPYQIQPLDIRKIFVLIIIFRENVLKTKMQHLHHNESEDEDAWILSIQNVGLLLYQVLYDIRFVDEEWKYLKDKHTIKNIIY